MGKKGGGTRCSSPKCRLIAREGLGCALVFLLVSLLVRLLGCLLRMWCQATAAISHCLMFIRKGEPYVDASKILGDVNVDNAIPLLDGPVSVVLYAISLPEPVSIFLYCIRGGEKPYH